MVDARASWAWPFPVRALVVADGGQLLGRCAAVDGLFVDVAVPREIVTLRGCRPGPVPGHLGRAWIEGLIAGEAVRWWELDDAEILTVGAADAGLVDVVLGAGVRSVDELRGAGPATRFDLSGPGRVVVASADAADGLDVHRPPPPRRSLRLIGLEPLTAPGAWPDSEVRVLPLDDTGRAMAEIDVSAPVEATVASVLGGGLLDVRVPAFDLPGQDARPAWEIWRRGRPREPGLWRDLAEPAREAWLDLTYGTLEAGRPDRSGGVHHLTGGDVTDHTGLHCALSEAIAGPGGYYGREWNALRDCLGGGFGVAPPFTLIWHGFAASGRVFDRDPASGRTYQDDIVDLLRRRRVVVVPQ
ncbi:barstar family protein [Dactylosporangium sp. NPDC050588]|uniref:barstar family protein n=1 Tax=Dactylosporangium sp. NPDC050588 TaxID=3157211 RepID=UPI0033D5D08C